MIIVCFAFVAACYTFQLFWCQCSQRWSPKLAGVPDPPNILCMAWDPVHSLASYLLLWYRRSCVYRLHANIPGRLQHTDIADRGRWSLLPVRIYEHPWWFAPVIEGLLYVEDFTTNWFSRTWPYMEFICTCSSIVNWKIKLIWQRRLLHMSISVEATGKYYTYNLCSICR